MTAKITYQAGEGGVSWSDRFLNIYLKREVPFKKIPFKPSSVTLETIRNAS